MKYEVELTVKADKDIRNIFCYISVNLNSLDNAKKQIYRIWKGILSLEVLPERYRIYEEEPWCSRGLRILPIDKFVILYIPYPQESIVRIITVMYGGRDIKEHLKNIY